MLTKNFPNRIKLRKELADARIAISATRTSQEALGALENRGPCQKERSKLERKLKKQNGEVKE